MKMLDDYFDLQAKIFDFFGYQDGWRAIPLDDARRYFWRLEGLEKVLYAETEKDLADETDDCFENDIYAPPSLSKSVYRADGYTLICVDTQTDGNKFMQVFDNALERS